MQLRFKRTYEVRFDECNLYGFVTPASALRYLQDIAGWHAYHISAGEPGIWVARRTILEFIAPIPARSVLEIETYSLGFTKVTGQRGYDVRLPNGDLALKGRTLWVYLDARGRPARVPASYQEIARLTGIPQDEAPLPPDPPRTPFVSSAPVRFSDLDVMSHMNNAAYVELFDNVAWEAFAGIGLLPDNGTGQLFPLHYDIEYQASAQAGDLMTVRSWFEKGAVNGPNFEFEQVQRVFRDNTTLARSRSRWRWQPSQSEKAPLPAFERLHLD